MQCGELFYSVGRGITEKTRHHCRYCGWVLCGRCCPDQKIPIDRWASSTPGHPLKRARLPRLKRVCKPCFLHAPAEVKRRTELDLQLMPPRGYAWIKQPTKNGAGLFQALGAQVPSAWPERFIEMAYASGTSKAVMGLYVYVSEAADTPEATESIDDLRGYAIETGVESWIGRGDYPKLTLSPEFSSAPRGDLGSGTVEERVFVFADELSRDRFADACKNLAMGRLWDASARAPSPSEGSSVAQGGDPRQELLEIYTRHNPRKVADIDQMMAEWASQQGGVAAMIPRIRAKYLRPPSPLPELEPEPEPEPEPERKPGLQLIANPVLGGAE